MCEALVCLHGCMDMHGRVACSMCVWTDQHDSVRCTCTVKLLYTTACMCVCMCVCVCVCVRRYTEKYVALNIVKPLLQALVYLHHKHIVHR